MGVSLKQLYPWISVITAARTALYRGRGEKEDKNEMGYLAPVVVLKDGLNVDFRNVLQPFFPAVVHGQPSTG